MVQRPRPTEFTEKLKEAWALVVAPENRRLSVAWLGCVVIVLALGLHSGVDTSTFVGIADSRESNINFDFPVNVASINALAGQSVKKGDLIAQVEQPELELKLQETRALLNKLNAERRMVLEMGQLGSLRSKAVAVDPSSDPLATEIKNLEDQVAVLENRQKSLYVFAPFDGVVGSVNFKKGETVKPFEPLISVSPSTPTYIDAFIHEALQTHVAVGQTVNVVSLNDSSREVQGHIVSMGSRIVELPIRIGRVQTTKMWGREIMIEIPHENPFLLGEKVEVSHPFIQISFPIARASEKKLVPSVKQAGPQLVHVPPAIKTVSSFEPSGAVYLKDLKKYLIASDDTDKDHSPMLFLMGRDGAVDTQVVRINGLKELHDIESVLLDESGTVYLLASQSPNKKGEIVASRNLLIRLKRNGVEFGVDGTVELRPLLLSAIEASKDVDLDSVRKKLKKDLEIEASYIENGHLKVGLKKPLLKNGSSLVLDLGPLKKLVEKKAIAAGDFKVDQKISFPEGIEKARITEMSKVGNKLIISTVSKKPERVGRLWAMNMVTKSLEKIGEYPGHSPEAVAYDSDAKELMILFDEKDSPALYMKNSSLDFN
jgi:hypothetical protein